MHVYHYAAYEPSTLSRLMGAHATREAEVDDLLRREILVDLFRVVRQGLRAGVRSYSLKEIEQFFFTRTADVEVGQRRRPQLRALPRRTATRRSSPTSRPTTRRTASRRSSSATGCSSSASEAEAEFGAEIPFRTPPEQREPKIESAEELSETTRLRAALLETADGRDERWLQAQLLDYHRREARPGWWWYFRRFEMTDEELIEDSEAIAGLEHGRSAARGREAVARVPVHVPAAAAPLRPRRHAATTPSRAARAGPSPRSTTPPARSFSSAARVRATSACRRRSSPVGPYPDRASSARPSAALAASMLADDGRYPALRRILRRDLPLDGAPRPADRSRRPACRSRSASTTPISSSRARRVGQDVSRRQADHRASRAPGSASA